MVLKIALLTYATKPRGSVIHTLELANALHHLGQEVCVFALDKTGEGFDRNPDCPYELVPAAPAPDNIDGLIQQRIGEFVQYLSDRRFADLDLYHAQDCISANALVALKSPDRPQPIVRTVHHIEDFTSPYLQACQDKSIRLPDRCLSVSQHWHEALHTTYGITAPRVINGVNLQRFSPQPNGEEAALKQRYGLTGSPVYFTVGGIEPRKNSLNLLRAFAQVRQQQPQAQLAIAGGATLFDYQPYRQQFFELATELELPLEQALVLPGVIPEADLPTLYRCADAFVFPSLKEGWGLVVLEALASGLPVVTADQPPFTEFLSSASALLVNPEREDAIATAMLQASQPQIRRQLQAPGCAVAARYSWATAAQQHLEQYRQLCAPSADAISPEKSRPSQP
jgi:glycosyltransferase-like protein